MHVAHDNFSCVKMDCSCKKLGRPDVDSNGCPVRQPFVINMSAIEMELTDMEDDMVLKNFSLCHSSIEFWRQVPEDRYLEIKKASA